MVAETVAEVFQDAHARERLEARFAPLDNPCDDFLSSLALAEELRGCFSREVRRAVRALRDCPHSQAGLLIRGAGRDRSLPATPSDADLFVERPSHVGEWILLVLASSLGALVSYREQRAGRLFNQIVPVKGFEDEISSQGSRTALGLHRECTFSEVGPDFLGLYCHRGGGAATSVVGATRIAPHLTDRQWRVLSEPRFVTPLPPAFRRDGGSAAGAAAHCIFSGERDHPEIRLDTTLTRGSDGEAQTVLAELNQILYDGDLRERIVLEPGDVLLLDNRKCLHGREAFDARFDGSDRWLVRLYVKSDIWSCRERLVGDHVLAAGQ